MKLCARCEKEIDGSRKKFCSDNCKYWYNSIKRDNEKHLPPIKKRNDNYFHMVIGSERASKRGQGRRCGHMVKGSMSAMVMVTIERIVPVNKENLERHFNGEFGTRFNLDYAKLCGGGKISREQYEKGQYFVSPLNSTGEPLNF